MSLPDPDEIFRRYQAEHDAKVALAERERNLYTLKTMHEDLLDKAQIYNQLGQEREMFACKLAARYILGAIENIKEAK